MKYNEPNESHEDCPFCNIKYEEIIYQNDFGKIILNLAPHKKDHLLVLSNRHIDTLSELTDKESLELHNLKSIAIKNILRTHKNFSILYREGGNSGKSINHLHVHIIPDINFLPKGITADLSSVYSKDEYVKLTEEFRHDFKV